MPTLIRNEVEWLKHHAKREDGVWKCKKTGSNIQVAEVGRSIWIPGFSGGFGEVRLVTHLACGSCDVGKVPPSHGTPVYENELVEL